MRPILFCLLLSPGIFFAQENAPEKTSSKSFFTLKTAPLNLINPVQLSADVLVDIPVKSRWALEMGLGVLLDSESYAQYTGESYTGIKVKPTLKYYLDRTEDQDYYIGLAFKYNYIHNERYVRMFRQGLQYLETSLQRRQVETWGAAFRIGVQLYAGKRNRFVVDPSFGFGIRQFKVGYPQLPADAELSTERGWFDLGRVPGTFRSPDLMFGCTLGWAFR